MDQLTWDRVDVIKGVEILADDIRSGNLVSEMSLLLLFSLLLLLLFFAGDDVVVVAVVVAAAVVTM